MMNNAEKIWKSLVMTFKKLYKNIVCFTEKNDKFIFIISLFIIAIAMFLLNYNTPLVADDYSYSFIYNTDKPVNSVVDVIKSQYIHYMTWGGRSVNHGIAQLLLMLNKNVISIINTIMYIIMGYLIYLNCNYGKKTNVLLYIGLSALIWIFQPVFGQSFLWVTGSANYMYGVAIVLAFLLVYRIRIVQKEGYKHENLLIPIMFIFGIIAGWTNENVAAAAIIVTGLYLAFYKSNGIKISKVDIAGLIGVVSGFCIMIAAPGNYIRKEHFEETDSFIVMIIKRILNCSESMFKIVLPLIVIYLVSLMILKYINKENKIGVSVIFLIGMFISIYSMVLSPYFPDRAWTGVIVYIIIAIGNIWAQLDSNNNLVKNLTYSVIFVIIIAIFIDYSNAYEESVRINGEWKQRIEYINEQKGKGNLDIEVEPIKTWNKYCGSVRTCGYYSQYKLLD